MIQISFILPFYDGADTVFSALGSINAMHMNPSDLEVIIIDDCSPISAESILYNYVEANPNVRIIRHETNKRQGGAKNTGIQAAKGAYIAFIDQDDVINPNHMQTALDFAIQKKVDMLACHYYVKQKDGELREEGAEKGNGELMSGKYFCEHYFQTSYNLAPWANLYNRDFLSRIARPFEENVVMEDSDWVAWHWIHAKKVGIYNKPIYTWIMNPLSITHSQHYINRADWIKYGYRKIRDSKTFANISPAFSKIMLADGEYNIIGGMKNAWKVDNYRLFYRHLEPILPALQKMKWPGLVKILINYPVLSVLILSILGPILKSYCAKYRFSS